MRARVASFFRRKTFALRRRLYPFLVPIPEGRGARVFAHAMAHAQRLPYHNKAHAAEVLFDARRIAAAEGLTHRDPAWELLEAAALLHDLVYRPGARDNEARSAALARRLLPRLGYARNEADAVARMILATALPQRPRTLPERILCDADLAGLGKKDFLRNSALLAREQGLEPTSLAFLEQAWRALKGHRFHTAAGQRLFGPGWEENRARLHRLLEDARARQRRARPGPRGPAARAP